MSQNIIQVGECEIQAEEYEITNDFFQTPAPFTVAANCDSAALADNWPSGSAFALWVNGEVMFKGNLS